MDGCFCQSAKSSDDGAIPAHQLWAAFVKVMWCTQGKGGGGGDLLHYSCHHLLPFIKSYSTGLGFGSRHWGYIAGLIPPAVLGATAWLHNLDYLALQSSLLWFWRYHHVQFKQPSEVTCTIGICWNGERLWGSKHKHRGTSTAITGINKESTKAAPEKVIT